MDYILDCLVNGVEGIIGFLEFGLLVTAVITRMRNLDGCLDFTGTSLKNFRSSVFIELEISRKNLREPIISCLDGSASRHVETKGFSSYQRW